MEGETCLGRIPNQYLIVQHVICLNIFKNKIRAPQKLENL